jgi:glycopeptide antibiotics resistance protein
MSPWKLGARVAYVAVIGIATLSNLGFESIGADELRHRLSGALSPSVTAHDVVDGLRNLLLFAGWGLAWCMTAPDNRLGRAILMATVTGLLLSTGVESAQLFSSRRQASILDVLTNTGGSLMGGLTAVGLLRAARAARSARSFFGMPMFVFAAAYGSAALLEILLPGLRQEFLPGASGGPVARFQLARDHMGWGSNGFGSWLLQVLLLLPAGAFAVAALAESGRPYARALSITAAAGVGLALILEFARGATGQPVELGIFTAHALGFTAGAWVTAYRLPAFTRTVRGRSRPRRLLGMYVVVLMLWGWRPFGPRFDVEELRQVLSAGHLMPLTALAMKTDMFSASDVAVSFLLHFPLGALLAVWPVRLRGWLAHAWAGIWIVLVVESGQLLVGARFFDVTDIIIAVSGVLAGWGLMRRAGFRPYGELLDRRRQTRP